MSDEEDDKQIMAATDWMLPALKEMAERSKADPEAREEFNRQAADWIISLITEIETWREVVRSLERTVESYKQANEIWMETGKHVQRQLAVALEEIRRGEDPAKVYDEYLRGLVEREDVDDDEGPVN